VARTYGNVFTAIWRDPDFQKLELDAQHAYLMLVTQTNISSVGTLPITARRWSSYCVDGSVERLSNALRMLSDASFVVIDDDLEELLVRSFVRWDGGYKNPKRLLAIKSAAMAVPGALLQGVLAGELDRLGITHEIPASPIDGRSIGIRSPIDPPRDVVTSGSKYPHPTTRIPETTFREPAKKDGPSRLPKGWEPSPRLIEWVKSECPTVDGRAETEKFIDWWAQKAGKDALKVDWDAAYRTWMRRTRDDPRPGVARPTRGGQTSTTDAKVAQTLAMGARLAEQEAAAESRREITA